MSRNYCKLIILIPLLTGCVSTLDRIIVLSEEFEAQSDVYVIEKPTWRVPDTVYNNKIGNYSVINADTSSDKLKEKLISRKGEENMINFFLLDSKDLYFEVEKYEVTDTIEYSFDVKNAESKLYESRCRVTALSLDTRKEATISSTKDEDKSPDFSLDRSINDRSARKSTYLLCSIKHDDKLLNLSLFSNEDRKVDVSLVGDDEDIIIKNVPRYIIIDESNKSGIDEDTYYPRRYAINSGLEFYLNNKQVSALSLIGKPRIWLSKDVSEANKGLLLTASYSLLMFDWLDPAWK